MPKSLSVTTLRIAMLVLLSMRAAAPAAASATTAPTPSDGYFYEVQKIAERVHLIYRPDPVRIPAEGNVEVIEQSDGLVVVDSGGTPIGGRRVVDKIKSISTKPVKFLIYTHWHGDHNLGAAAFRAAYPAMRIISTEQTRLNMTGAPMRYIATLAPNYRTAAERIQKRLQDPMLDSDQRAHYIQALADAPGLAAAYDDAKAIPADITFSDKLSIPDADAPAELLFLGKAHTDGDAVVWLPAQKIMVTGDIVASPYPLGTDSYPREWVEVLHRIEGYDFAKLVPGHGPVESDRGYVDRLIALIEDVRSQVGPLAKRGVALDDVYKQVNFDKEYALFGGTSMWLHNGFKGNFIDPMVQNAYKEARDEPISQNPGG